MILYIDATNYNKAVFALKNGKVFVKTYTIDPRHVHQLTACLEKFFKAGHIKINQLNKVVVNKGPGSFTGVRISVAIAQALHLAWGIPFQVLSKSVFQI